MATPRRPKKPKLRAVGASDPAPPPAKKKLTVAEAAASGSQRDLLEAMRDTIATTITNGCPPRDLASLTKRLSDIVEQLRTLEIAEAEEAHDGDSTPDETWDEAAL